MLRLLGFGKQAAPPSESPQIPPNLVRKTPLPPPPPEWHTNPLAFRIAIDSAGAMAYGLPSGGGVLLKRLNAVDLEYLRASRATPTRRPSTPTFSTETEEEWCSRLRRLAPYWYFSVKDWDRALNTRRPHTTCEKQQVYVGHDSCSETYRIWVLRIPDKLSKPQDWGRYELCLTMQERCEVLKQLGATAYLSVEDVDELNPRHDNHMQKQRDDLEDTRGPFRDSNDFVCCG